MKNFKIILISFVFVLISNFSVSNNQSNDIVSKSEQDKNIEKEVKRKKEYNKPFLGIYMIPKCDLKDIDEKYKDINGISIPVVLYKSAAEKAGILKGDIIIEYDNNNFNDLKKDEINKTFRNYIRDKKEIGQELKLKIIRQITKYKGDKNQIQFPEKVLIDDELFDFLNDQKTGETINLNIEKYLEELELTAVLERKKDMLNSPPPSNKELYNEYEITFDPFIYLYKSIISHYNINESHEDLLERYKEDEWFDDGYRFNIFRYIHRDPAKLPVIANDITILLESSYTNNELSIPHLFKAFGKITDEKINIQTKNISFKTNNNSLKNNEENVLNKNTDKHYFNNLLILFKKSLEIRNLAFSKIEQQDYEFLEQNVIKLMKKLVNHYYLDSDAKLEEMENHRKVINLSHKIDYSLILESMFYLSMIANKNNINELKNIILKNDFNKIEKTNAEIGVYGDVLAFIETEIGEIVIGGPGFTKYVKNYPIIIDIGGNDLYLNNAGEGLNNKKTVSIIIDFDGDDYYASTEPIAQGSGFLGCSLLVDLKGNDIYNGTLLSQGCGLMGAGLLIDFCGNDRYYGQEFAQGVGFWGIGSLIDCSGDDIFHSNLFSQGVGGTKGLGFIFDINGDDYYYASGKYKSSYETDGIYRGSSQGFGIGFRGIASGGIGILLDSKGSDNFIAGNFSQGGGYFFGLGILKNNGYEDDKYTASRYGQGFSAHSAAGILIDVGGNDYYKGLHGALQAAAWDKGTAALVDNSGNDIYDAQMTFFAQGAASHNGFALFIDKKGSDKYFTESAGMARVNSNDYHDGSSLGFFIDNGGEIDWYSDGSLNNTIFYKGNYSFFIDLPWLIQNNLSPKKIKDFFND